MSFIQIIEYDTDRADEMLALGQARMAEMGDTPPGFRLTITQDRDNPNRYVTIVEFPSYEVAMENSGRPETDEFAKQMAALCTSGPSFRNLDVKRTVPS
jgi:quinol monooxygenase YgiN